MPKQCGDSDWEQIRKKLLKQEDIKQYYVDGDVCRKCVWSVTESGKIFCTKSCRKKGNKV